MRQKFSEINSPLLKDVRGRGFMNAIEVDSNSHVTGVDLCNIFQEYGVLTKATKNYSIRFTPGLIMTKEEVDQVASIIAKSFEELEKLNDQRANLNQTID